jgi:hypothetical protein
VIMCIRDCDIYLVRGRVVQLAQLGVALAHMWR